MIKSEPELTDMVRAQPFFAGLGPDAPVTLAACARVAAFGPGAYLAHEGEEADSFYAVLHGSVAIETDRPGLGPAALQTLHAGDVVGWSWLFPQHSWSFDARALEETRTLMFDGAAVRDVLERDPRLGYQLMRRFAGVMSERLRAARLQLLDLYGRSDA